MSQVCGMLKCERTVRGLCDCCKQKLCLQHLNEHNILLISELNPLIDEINALGDRLKSFSNHKTARDSRRKLEHWRKECYEKIDHFFEKKSQELDQLIATRVAKQQETVLQIQSNMAKFIREQEATRHDIDSCIEVIRQLENEMNKIEEKCFQIKTGSLAIDDSLIQIQDANVRKFDLSVLPHVYRTLDRPTGSYTALATNNQFLLMHQEPNLCLVDKEMNIVKQVLWTYDVIWDMCWSLSLNRFVIIEENNIFLLDETTMFIEKLRTDKTKKWVSCVSFDTFLVLSTQVEGAFIVKLSLRSSIAIVERWKSFSIREKYESIEGIVSNNETFVLMIRDKLEKSLRMELRSRKTLDRIWSLPLNIVCNQDRRINCCSLHSDGWLVADYETERLLHITKDGKIKKTTPYQAIPYCVTLFNANILVVSRNGGINFYKI